MCGITRDRLFNWTIDARTCSDYSKHNHTTFWTASRKESKKVRVGRYGIDELTKDVDCDVLFESAYLDGVNPLNKGDILS